MPWLELLGYAAAATVFATFSMTTMLPLRILAVASNVMFGAYGFLADLHPILFLHLVLFPINVYRLAQIVVLVRRIGASEDTGSSFKRLVPLMTHRRFAAGATLFRKGDAADRLFYIAKGTLRIEELNKELGPGEVIGEIGLFAPDHKRTASIVCKTDCELYELGDGKAKELYFQNPSFAYALLQLIVSRLIENNAPIIAIDAAEVSPG